MDGESEKYNWRENGECMSQVEAKKLSDASRNKICQTVQTKYPKKNMCAKALMLNDLLTQFAQRKSDPHNACREALKNNSLHVVKKPKLSVVPLRGESIKRAASLLMNRASDNQVSELVTVMKSSKFKITDQRNEMNMVEAIRRISCYVKTPRKLSPEMHDDEIPVFRDDVTTQLEELGIECSLYDVRDPEQELKDCEAMCDKVSEESIKKDGLFQDKFCDYSSRFGEYCTNMINPELNGSLEKFVSELSRLQRSLYNRNNIRGVSKRRLYTGFRETRRRLLLKKLKLVIVPTDVQTNKFNGDLNEMMTQFIKLCDSHEVPVIFGLSRRKLGYLIHGKAFVGCIGVANYESLEDKLEDVLVKVVKAKNHFKILKGEPDKTIDVDVILTDDLLLSERVKVLLKTLAKS